MDIGSIIKEYRSTEGLTQVELASKANISRSYLADVEKNRYNASVETLRSIARALKIPMATLLCENSYSIELLTAIQIIYGHKFDHLKSDAFLEMLSKKLDINNEELFSVSNNISSDLSLTVQAKLINYFKTLDMEAYLNFAKDNVAPANPNIKNFRETDNKIKSNTKGTIAHARNMTMTLGIIPEEFTDPKETRIYIGKHKIFSSEGFDVNKLSDEEVLEFGNALLEQMKMVSYKYKK